MCSWPKGQCCILLGEILTYSWQTKLHEATNNALRFLAWSKRLIKLFRWRPKEILSVRFNPRAFNGSIQHAVKMWKMWINYIYIRLPFHCCWSQQFQSSADRLADVTLPDSIILCIMLSIIDHPASLLISSPTVQRWRPPVMLGDIIPSKAASDVSWFRLNG